MASAGKIAIIGAGSATFSLNVIRDLCMTPQLAGTTVSLMDIDEERLAGIHRLAERYAGEMQVDLRFEKTTDRRAALQDASFVINTAMTGGFGWEDELLAIAEKHGYYRGACPAGFWGSIRMPFLHGYHQLNLLMDIAVSVAEICPQAWLIQSSNPVFDGCTLMNRKTGLKIIGLCHGHANVYQPYKALGLDVAKGRWQAPGCNHVIYLTRFEYEGRDMYPLFDDWLAANKDDPRPGDFAPATLNEYKLLGVLPIGDTIRRGRWIYHRSLAVKKEWYDAKGGPDSEVSWQNQLNQQPLHVAKIFQVAHDPAAKVTEVYKPRLSGEQQVPIINALVNGVAGDFQVNVPNRGAIKGIADDVVVEVPATIDKNGIHVHELAPLPTKVQLTCLIPYVTMMECNLYAFEHGDKDMLLLTALEDPRTHSLAQAQELLDALFAHPFNSEAACHFGFQPAKR